MNEYTVSFPGLGIHDLHIKSEAFRLFGVPVYWYGILIATAVLLSMLLAMRSSKRYGLTQDNILDILLAAIPLAIIGARVYYVIFSWDSYKDNWLKVFDTRAGGLAFYGGVIGGILGALIVCKVKKLNVSRVFDFLIVYIPLGQAIGRWGNFFNQEAFGNNTALPWGMISNGTRSYLASLNNPALNPDLPVHPTFLYEFLGNMLIFVILLLIRRQSRHRFETLAWYLFLYGTLRFFVESVRTDALYLGKTQIPVSMLLSALMVLGGIAYAGYIRLYDRRHPEYAGEPLYIGDLPTVAETEIEDTPVVASDDSSAAFEATDASLNQSANLPGDLEDKTVNPQHATADVSEDLGEAEPGDAKPGAQQKS